MIRHTPCSDQLHSAGHSVPCIHITTSGKHCLPPDSKGRMQHSVYVTAHIHHLLDRVIRIDCSYQYSRYMIHSLQHLI